MSLTILNYDDYRVFLKDVLDEKVRKNSTFSMRALARMFGLSPSHLSRTISGQKRLSPVSARQISVAMNHSPEEAEHLLGLIDLDSSESTEQKSKVLRRLSRLSEGRAKVLSLEAFHAIAEWHHFAILELTRTKGFQADSHWIAKRLGIKPLEARLAIERLLNLGLLVKSGRTYRVVDDADLSTTDDVTSAAIQENHRQHLAMAASALQDIAVELREFNNLTISMNLSDVPKAKKMIRSFLERFNRELTAKQGQELFQFNIQYYLLSRNEKGRA